MFEPRTTLVAALLLAGCRDPATAARQQGTREAPTDSRSASQNQRRSPTPLGSASSAAPSLDPSPFFPVATAEGQPSTAPLVLSRVIGATLFLAQGHPTWKIGKLEGDVIRWNALPPTGLPSSTAWDSVVGRYPDPLWLRSPSETGGLDWYRWHPLAQSWVLDKRMRQGRRTDVFIGRWSGDKLLALIADPESMMRDPPRATLVTLPDHGSPRLARLPRLDPSAVETTESGEVVAAFGAPVELVILGPGSRALRRFPLPVSKDAGVMHLLVKSASDASIVVSDGDRAAWFVFDGERWSERDLPAARWVTSLVATSDGTFWLLDDQARVWKRAEGGAWERVSLPQGSPPPAVLRISEDRVWLQLTSEAEGMGPLLTTTRVKEG